MASPPVGPRPRRRAALNVEKTTQPKLPARGISSSKTVARTPAKKPTRTSVRTASKQSTAAADEARQAVAERIVRKIFAEAGIPPEQVTIGTESRASAAKQAPTLAVSRNRRVAVSDKAVVEQSTTADEVVMPSNASERLLSKAAALEAWYRRHFPRKVGMLATVAGLAFSAVGGLSLIPFVSAMYPDWHSFQSALVCETLNCEQVSISSSSTSQSSTETTSTGSTQTNTTTSGGTTNTTTQTATAVPSPALSFLTAPPAVLIGPATIVVRAEHVSSLVVLAESRATGQTYQLRREGEPAGPDHTFVMAPAQFPPAEYNLRARAVALRDNKVVYVTGPRFKVEQRVSETIQSSGATSTNTSGTSEPQTGSLTPPPVTTTEPVTTPPEEDTPEVVATSTVPVATTPPPATLAYTRPAPGVIAVSVVAADSSGVEIYAQRLNATAPVLVGVARRVDTNRWLLSYDTRSLPNGSYVLVGRVKTVRGIFDTPRVPLYVENRVESATTPAPATTTRAAVETTETIERLREANNPLPDRTAYTEALPDEPETPATAPVIEAARTVPPALPRAVVVPLPVTSVPEPLRPVVRERFTESADELNDLFKRYASAVQTNDDSMRTLIEDELTKKRARMVSSTITDGEPGVTASDLDQSLATEFERLKERVETFETLLRDRSGQNSATDQDGDGISDHDEVTLYGTDPALFDTDSDGVSDGAEIMRGFDPQSSEEEAVMTYTSPKEFGIVREDVLTVAAVTPVIETDRERGTPPVQAEIRGTGIPNSFVTLFIFSSPTVVTVRTADDGSFVYQFDKELEDGSHEVYVAVTDNTGDIIAKSNPFTFVKEAEAFTVVDAASAAPVASTDPAAAVSISQLYQVITAMVVLAFGLILLIFGMVMRREPMVTETTPPAVG